MWFIKLMFSAGIIAASAEVAKRSEFWGAVIIALPLSSMLAMLWLYSDTHDSAKVSLFARDIFFLVPPSLLFFVPFLFEPKTHWPFWLSFVGGLLFMGVGMAAVKFLLK
jgi:hypothetical protein